MPLSSVYYVSMYQMRDFSKYIQTSTSAAATTTLLDWFRKTIEDEARGVRVLTSLLSCVRQAVLNSFSSIGVLDEATLSSGRSLLLVEDIGDLRW